MKHRIYKNFDLSFEFNVTDDYGVYIARLINSPSGQAQVEFGIRYSRQHGEGFKTSNSWPTPSYIDLANSTPSVQTALTPQVWGELLFSNTFHDDLLRCWTDSLSKARTNGFGLRILLRFNKAPGLAFLPWEYLYDHHTGGFFALSDDTPIVRYPEIPQGANAEPITEKLCMLIVVAQPSDASSPLNVERELSDLQYVLKDSRARILKCGGNRLLSHIDFREYPSISYSNIYTSTA